MATKKGKSTNLDKAIAGLDTAQKDIQDYKDIEHGKIKEIKGSKYVSKGDYNLLKLEIKEDYNQLKIEVDGLKGKLEKQDQQLTTLYGYYLTAKYENVGLNGIEKKLEDPKQVELASKNLEEKVEPEKTIPFETTAIPILDNSPSPKENLWKISVRLKDYFSNMAGIKFPSLSRKAKITAAALAIAGLLGYVGHSRLKSEPETIKINREISLKEKCPDMIIAYSNKEAENQIEGYIQNVVAHTLEGKFIYSIFPGKSYMQIESSIACKDGTWNFDIYNAKKGIVNLSLTNILNKINQVTREQKEIRNSIKNLKVVKKPVAKQIKKRKFNPFD